MTIARPPTTNAIPHDRFVFYDVDWDFYEMTLQRLGGRNVRVSYDGKDLEIMSPLPEHETWKCNIRRLIEVLCDTLNIPLVGRGSTTLKLRKKGKGVEPDQCYYVQNESLIRSSRQPDLQTDPPPDLVVEVDVTSSSVDRQQIYADLGVPEIWRFDGETIEGLELGPDGKYRPREFGAAFPFLRVADLAPFVRRGAETDHTTLAREFREWVLRNLGENRRP